MKSEKIKPPVGCRFQIKKGSGVSVRVSVLRNRWRMYGQIAQAVICLLTPET
jgi:hypothetical protein